MPFGSVGKKRPRSPSPSIDESEMPDPKILEQDFRKKTGLLVRHFNPEYHNSYTSRTVKKMKRMRSGEGFIPPLGYTKLALNVEGKFPDDGWLDKKNGWHVVYHGTRCRPCIIKSIVLEGFKIKGGKKEAANGTLFGRVSIARLIQKRPRNMPRSNLLSIAMTTNTYFSSCAECAQVHTKFIVLSIGL